MVDFASVMFRRANSAKRSQDPRLVFISSGRSGDPCSTKVSYGQLVVKRRVCEGSVSTVESLRKLMRKNERIGLRVTAELKRALIQIAKKEGRSLAQVCEILLRNGVLLYDEEGHKGLQRFIARQKKDRVDSP